MTSPKPGSTELAQTIRKRMAGQPLNHQKLQKLCCLADGWWLAYHDEPLIQDRQAALTHGPVFKDLYELLKDSLNDDLPEVLDGPAGTPEAITIGPKGFFAHIDWIIQRYGRLSGVELSNLLVAGESPWQRFARARRHTVRPWENIPDDLIRDYYRTMREREGI